VIGHATPLRYLATFGAWSLAGQALLANTAVQAAAVVPFARWQGALVQRYLIDGPLMVTVDPSCSGLEVLALCLAATLAYPVAWRRRLIGAGLGVLLILALNAVRIASLAGASQSPWFGTLHTTVWPTILVVATAGWVVVWIRSTDRATNNLTPMARRFVAWSAALLAVYAVAVPVLTEAQMLTPAARGAANAAAAILNGFGADASVTLQLLSVGRMQYLVTPDCVATPLIAFYFAAVFASPLGWRTRLLGVVAAVPLFSVLAVLRLLTVALPVAAADATLVLTHAFNQILLGAAVLVAVALWRSDGHSRPRAVAVALGVAVAVAVIAVAGGFAVAAAWAGLLEGLHLAAPPGLPGSGAGDGQGALLAMPIYQLAVFAGAWILARRHAAHARWATAAVMLVVSQFVLLTTLGWMHSEGIRPFSALAIRAWSVAVPVLMILVVVRSGHYGDSPAEDAEQTLALSR
jgi:exosortase/archaeosortase family protein